MDHELLKKKIHTFSGTLSGQREIWRLSIQSVNIFKSNEAKYLALQTIGIIKKNREEEDVVTVNLNPYFCLSPAQ